jgi:hypothetical protein
MLVDYQEHGASRAHEAGLDFSLRQPGSSTGTLIDISLFFLHDRPPVSVLFLPNLAIMIAAARRQSHVMAS